MLGYRAGTGTRWPAILIVGAIHCVGFMLLGYLDVLPAAREPDHRLVVSLFDIAPPPPKAAPPVVDLPVDRVVPPHHAGPLAVFAPTPVARDVVPDAPVIRTTPTPPLPAAPVPASASPPAPAATQTVAIPVEPISDLNARLVAAKMPRYPVESRRRRETGVVVLLVDVTEEGRVSSIAVQRSSGYQRLDQAALRAVREWRWSPTLVDGRPAALRGLVRIPFVLAT